MPLTVFQGCHAYTFGIRFLGLPLVKALNIARSLSVHLEDSHVYSGTAI